MATLPEFRLWLKSLAPVQLAGHLSRFSVALVIVPLFFFKLSTGFGEAHAAHAFATFAKVFIYFMPGFHTLRQIGGLSSAYNQKLRVHSGSVEPKGAGTEKTLLLIFIITILAPGYFLIRKFRYLHPTLTLLFFVVNFTLIGAIFLNSYFMFPERVARFKLIYQLRLLMFPLSYVWPLVSSGLAGMHGIEYWCVWRKMSAHSVRRSTLWTRFTVTITVFAVGAVGFLGLSSGVLHGWVSPYLQNSDRLFINCAALSASLTYIHYYLDREIFRMKNSSNRKYLGPLLTGPLLTPTERQPHAVISPSFPPQAASGEPEPLLAVGRTRPYF